VKDGTVWTPRGNILEGITRQTVLDLAVELGVPARQADLSPDALRTADEAFLSSTAGGIMPVSRVDGKPLGAGRPGPITTRFRTLYWEKREAGWRGTAVADLVG
jgi:branched-chain amino acid aminotransferase